LVYENFIIAKSYNQDFIDIWVKSINQRVSKKYSENYWYKVIFRKSRTSLGKYYTGSWYGDIGDYSYSISKVPNILLCYILSSKFSISLDDLNVPVLDLGNIEIDNSQELSLKEISELYNPYLDFRTLLLELGILRRFSKIPLAVHEDFGSFLYLENKEWKSKIFCNISSYDNFINKLKNKIMLAENNNISLHSLFENNYDTKDMNKYKIYIKNEIKSYSISEYTIKRKKDISAQNKIRRLESKKRDKLETPTILDTNKKYLTAREALELCKASFSVITFNRILNQLGMLTKVEYKENILSNWIIVNEGLFYGDNIFKSEPFSYLEKELTINLKKILCHDEENEIYGTKYSEDRICSYNNKKIFEITTLKWKSDKFLKLYKIVRDVYIEEKK